MPDKVQLSNRKIAQNTLLLYFRMIIVIIIGLYTSRIILRTLGVNDFGIYNVVGGIVAMLAFLNAAMVSSTQRYISFEIGTGNLDKLKKIFCTSVQIHITLAFIIFIIAETLGLWFINSYLNISSDRMNAANWVYQCSIITLMLTIISVPYNSCIVAHEHMKTYAYISILEAVLKLLIVYLLLIINYDKLVVYAILITCVALIIRIIYGVYCNRCFEECKYHILFDKTLFKDMFSFAGWSVLGNLGFSARDHGQNIILNIFFGAAINAARGIALQVNGIISNFSNNFTMSLNPQITKLYASGDIDNTINLVYMGCRFSFFLFMIIAIPVMINIEYILHLWLIEVPIYTPQFLMLSLIAALINVMSPPLVTAIQATGKIRAFQLSICIIMLCELPLTYLILLNGCKPYFAMYPAILIMTIGLFSRFIILKKQIRGFDLNYFTKNIFCKNLLIAGSVFYISNVISNYFKTNLFTLCVTSIISILISIIFIYLFGLSKKERTICNHKIFAFLLINKNAK